MKTLKLLPLLAVLPALAFAQATIVTKEAEGEAAIVNKDEKKAFEEAQQQALRSAVEQSAGVRIDADTLVVNNQLVRDQIFSNTSGYVKSFEVVSKASEKGVVKVKVKAQVITDNLDKDITAARSLVKRMGKPSLVILVNETTLQMSEKGQAVTSSDSVATVLTQAFKADGWDIRDPAFAAGKVRVAAGATLGSTEAKEIGDLSKAAFILYGTATLRNAELEGWMKGPEGKQIVFPVTGEYDFSLFSTSSGSQIAKVSGKLVMQNSGNELAGAKKMVVSYERTAFDVVQSRKAEITGGVRGGVLEWLRDQSVNGMALQLSVDGLESFGAAKDFKKAIEAIKGIKEATQDGFANGKAAYRVTFLGSAQDLAEQVEAATFKKKKLAIVSVTSNTLEVKVGK